MKNPGQTKNQPPALHARVREILQAARTGISRTVNTNQVVANWLIGREIGRRSSGAASARSMARG